jgi:hypothetical protein
MHGDGKIGKLRETSVTNTVVDEAIVTSAEWDIRRINYLFGIRMTYCSGNQVLPA